MRRLLPLLALTLLTAAASAQIVKKGNAYAFTAKYVKGRTYGYHFTTLVNLLSDPNVGKQNITLKVVMVVMEIKNRIARIRSEVGPWLMNGKQFRPKSSVTVHVDNKNRVVGENQMEIPQFSAPLPPQAVKIGGTWSSMVDTQGSTPQPIRVKQTFKLIRVADGKAYVGVTYSGGGEKVKTTGQGTMILRTSDSSLDSMSVQQTVSVPGGVNARTVIMVKRTA